MIILAIQLLKCYFVNLIASLSFIEKVIFSDIIISVLSVMP